MWRALPFDVSMLVLAVVYLVMAVVCTALYVSRWHWRGDVDPSGSTSRVLVARALRLCCCGGDAKGRTASFSRLFFLVFFLLGAVSRAVYFALAPLQKEDNIELSNAVDFFFNTVSSYFFLTCYSIMLYAWGQVYWQADAMRPSDLYVGSTFAMRTGPMLRRVLVAVNGVMYTCIAALYITDIVRQHLALMDATGTPDRRVSVAESPEEKALIGLSTVLYVVAPFGFFGYGYALFKAKHVEQTAVARTPDQRRLLRHVFWNSAVMIAAFFVRAVITILQLVLPFLGSSWYVIFVYFLVLEVIPLGLMVNIMTIRDRAAHDSSSVPAGIDTASYFSHEPLLHAPIRPSTNRADSAHMVPTTPDRRSTYSP